MGRLKVPNQTQLPLNDIFENVKQLLVEKGSQKAVQGRAVIGHYCPPNSAGNYFGIFGYSRET